MSDGATDARRSQRRIGIELGMAVVALSSLVAFLLMGFAAERREVSGWIGVLPVASVVLALATIVLQTVRRRRGEVHRSTFRERLALMLSYLVLAVGLALLFSPTVGEAVS